MNDAPHIHVCDSVEAVCELAARSFVECANTNISQHGKFTVALSGGSTPKGMYQRLVDAHKDDLDWSQVEFFFSDERTVPPDHDDSNYGMAKAHLLQPLNIGDSMVHRLCGELDPHDAAINYQRKLAESLDHDPLNPDPLSSPPALDLVLLGIGPDGHTASLFPHTEALQETERWVVANEVPQHNTWRLTMTAPLINAARRIVILATGAAKAPAVSAIIEGALQPNEYPCQLICPAAGGLTWIVDREAAGSLTRNAS